MRIPSTSTDRYLAFVAVDATDLKTRETGLSGFVVRRSRNGAAEAGMTTPTVVEPSSANMPGVYWLLLDEDTTITAGHDEEEMLLHITHASMAPVTRTVEIYRSKATEGNTATLGADGRVAADIEEWLGVAPLALSSQRVQALAGAITAGIIDATAAPNLDVAVSTRAPEAGGNLAAVLARIIGTLAAGTHSPQSGDAHARIGAAGASLTALGDARLANLDAAMSTRALEAGGNLATILARIIGTLAAGTHEPQSGDSYARLGAAGASLTALASAADLATVDMVVDAIKLKTDNLPEGIKKNTALSAFEFLMVDFTDGVTPKTGLTITAQRSIDGGAFGACTNTATEVSLGIYKINLSAADTNGDVITYCFTGTGALARYITVKTNP